MNKKHIFLVATVSVIVLGYFGYAYITRPLKAPSDIVLEQTSSASEVAYRIAQEKSKAEFRIDEILRGKPVTVVGITDAVNGIIYLNINDPRVSRIGAISVNARTLKTDDENRNRAIARFILKSEQDENEFIVFTPKELKGFPEHISYGEDISFDIVGDLFISGVTKETVFRAKIRITEDAIVGEASSSLQYKDFGLVIPNLPFLAGVDEIVYLTFAFTAFQ